MRLHLPRKKPQRGTANPYSHLQEGTKGLAMDVSYSDGGPENVCGQMSIFCSCGMGKAVGGASACEPPPPTHSCLSQAHACLEVACKAVEMAAPFWTWTVKLSRKSLRKHYWPQTVTMAPSKCQPLRTYNHLGNEPPATSMRNR